MNLIVHVAKKYRSYFGLQHWGGTSTALNSEVVRSNNKILKISQTNTEKIQEISFGRLSNNHEKRDWFGQRLANLVQRSSSVNGLHFLGHCENINLNFVKKVVGDANIEELSVDYHYKSM